MGEWRSPAPGGQDLWTGSGGFTHKVGCAVQAARVSVLAYRGGKGYGGGGDLPPGGGFQACGDVRRLSMPESKVYGPPIALCFPAGGCVLPPGRDLQSGGALPYTPYSSCLLLIIRPTPQFLPGRLQEFKIRPLPLQTSYRTQRMELAPSGNPDPVVEWAGGARHGAGGCQSGEIWSDSFYKGRGLNGGCR